MLLSIILVISFGFVTVSSFAFVTPFIRPGTFLKAVNKLDGVTIEGDLSPTSNNVFVKVKDAESVAKFGFIIPDAAQERASEGTFVSAGSGKFHHDVQLQMSARAGANVLYGKYDGSEMNYNGVVHQTTKDGVSEATLENEVNVISKHTNFHLTMYRLLNSKTPSFKARPKGNHSGSFDIVVDRGLIQPLKNNVFKGPNGASFRPNTLEEYYLVSGRSKKSYLCEIPAGTAVPADCVLVHEFGDHYSLQPATVMSVEHFNFIVTDFLKARKVYSRDEWLLAHPMGSQLIL